MKRKTLKKALSAFLSLLMCMMTLLSISTPVFAATTVDAYMVDFPRDGDSNYSATAWGHSATSLMGGWRFLNSKYTTVHSIGTYNGQVSYCIEPGIGQNAGDTLSHKDETFWENYPSHLNPTISPDTIKVLLGRIMQYGYQGNVSTSWRSQNASDAAALSHAIATQLLVWETVVGERDASFNKVDPSGYAAFHERFIKGHITLVGCPKLDGVDYSEKLTEIIRENNIRSVTVVRMEVPCCGGLELAVKKALQQSGKFIPWQVVTVTVDGRLVEE